MADTSTEELISDCASIIESGAKLARAEAVENEHLSLDEARTVSHLARTALEVSRQMQRIARGKRKRT
jgi:hypothetical protein